MKKKHLYIVLLLAFFTGLAQENNQAFLKAFEKARPVGKIKMVAAKNFSEISDIYPLIKDTLDKIKKAVYRYNQPVKLKFLFDKIEADKLAYYKNYARAIFILERSLRDNCPNVNDSIRCLVRLKFLFLKIKNYNKALELNHQIESKWAHKTDSTLIYPGASKSSIYFQIGLVDKAISERRKEYNKVGTRRNANATASFYNDLGVFYNFVKNSDSAKYNLLKAKKILALTQYPKARRIPAEFFRGLVDGNLGLAYYNAGEIKEAIPLLQRDIYYSLKAANYGSALNSYLVLVQSQLDLKNTALAKSYLDSAQTLITNNINDLKPKLKFILAQAGYEDRTGNYKKANENYRLYADLSNKAEIIDNEQRMQNEKMSMSVDQKESELAQRDNMLRQIQLKEAKQRSLRAYLIAGSLVMLVIIAFLLINNYNFKKREAQLSVKNQQIGSQKFQIEQSLKEKDVLIKEIHHRVKNNLQIITSMLSLQIAKVEDEKTSAILRDAKQRISSIALTHQMLYQKENLTTVNLGEYLERLARQVEMIMPPSGIGLVTDIQFGESRLTIDNAVPLGLLVNELLTNAYKHAFPEGTKGQITVTLAETEHAFTLSVSDNGVGLPDNFSDVERKTLGMELIYILAEQLDSSLLIENASGSSFKLNVKKN